MLAESWEFTLFSNVIDTKIELQHLTIQWVSIASFFPIWNHDSKSSSNCEQANENQESNQNQIANGISIST